MDSAEPAPALAAPLHSFKELMARKNQLEVHLAALQRTLPDPLQGSGGPEAPARGAWDRLRDELLAVERDLRRVRP